MQSSITSNFSYSSYEYDSEADRSAWPVATRATQNEEVHSTIASLEVAHQGHVDLLNRWSSRSRTRHLVGLLGEAKLKVFQVVRHYQVSCFLQGKSSATVMRNQSVVNGLLDNLRRFPALLPVPRPVQMQWLLNMMAQGQPYCLYQAPVASAEPSRLIFGYFKADKNLHAHAELQDTLVRSASGKAYALLNTLRPETCSSLEQVFGMHFQPGKKIFGSGGNGKVRLAQEYESKKFFSVKKTYDITRAPRELILGKQIVCAYQAEFGNQSALGVVAANDYAYREVAGPHATTYKNYFFMPLVIGSDLTDVIRQAKTNSNLSDQHVLKLFIHLAASCCRLVANVHDIGFSHRDIKSNNFLCGKTTVSNQNNQILLCDFALATTHDKDSQRMLSTPLYCPPEFFNTNQPYSGKLHDAFSLGVDMLSMLTPQFSYYKAAVYQVCLPGGCLEVSVHVVSVQLEGRQFYRCLGVNDDTLKVLASVPDSFMRIMLELLAANPKHRLTAAQAASRLEFFNN